jgi:hypothetical protein
MFVQCKFGQEKLFKQNAVLQTKGLDSVKFSVSFENIFLLLVRGNRDKKLTGMSNMTVCTLVLSAYLYFASRRLNFKTCCPITAVLTTQ